MAASRRNARTWIRSDARSKIGTFLTIPSVAIVEIAGIAGLDAVIVDFEHGTFNVGDLPACPASALMGPNRLN